MRQAEEFDKLYILDCQISIPRVVTLRLSNASGIEAAFDLAFEHFGSDSAREDELKTSFNEIKSSTLNQTQNLSSLLSKSKREPRKTP